MLYQGVEQLVGDGDVVILEGSTWQWLENLMTTFENKAIKPYGHLDRLVSSTWCRKDSSKTKQHDWPNIMFCMLANGTLQHDDVRVIYYLQGSKEYVLQHMK